VKAALTIGTAVAALLAGGLARAECLDQGVQSFPAPNSILPTNAKLVLEGIGGDAEKVNALVGKQVVLRAWDDAVSVTVKKGWKSKMGRIAVQLWPNAELRADRTYKLQLPSELADVDVQNGDELAWKTGQGRDTRAPIWTEKPAVTQGEYRMESGRPVRNLTLHMRLEEESPAYLVVALRRARGDATVQTYFVPVNGGEAAVGHDQCSGGFTFDDGRAYKAAVTAFDTAGNAAPAVRELEVHAPRKELPQ
jgi:hypothetical protein